eukprot:CAMPEP_0205820670 /NCGR_PEP_ID=MMETSP0206-20130828/3337_1 /ASSEMBLY_ACC=CAM_ASM_000279 /TAXON_ID=36767 /ORGANISM="Euplotes focardii, Strain TN1" /LENGTH=217 /DNA_ID=CAMNT_0053115601 /DNA_START=26 /DNA_END=679 /DNA_ORIENTATION=+
MVKHNNEIPNQHFRKDWQRRVRTWFNQPAGKVRRRNARVEKAKRLAPRPINQLRPIVRCQTVKYNTKVRAGRGFTLDEIKAAKINIKEARGFGIAVDHRRKNRSEEDFQQNVQRLKAYKAKLIVFPRKPTSKRAKAGDSTREERAAASQVTTKRVLPISKAQPRIKPRKITAAEKDFNAQQHLRKALTDTKLWGQRERRAAQKAEAAAQAALKKKRK